MAADHGAAVDDGTVVDDRIVSDDQVAVDRHIAANPAVFPEADKAVDHRCRVDRSAFGEFIRRERRRFCAHRQDVGLQNMPRFVQIKERFLPRQRRDRAEAVCPDGQRRFDVAFRFGRHTANAAAFKHTGGGQTDRQRRSAECKRLQYLIRFRFRMTGKPGQLTRCIGFGADPVG